MEMDPSAKNLLEDFECIEFEEILLWLRQEMDMTYRLSTLSYIWAYVHESIVSQVSKLLVANW